MNKLHFVHVQNATLAGGVAVGTAADTMLQPYGACLVGAAAGFLSTVGYRFIQPLLLTTIHLHDTCGVNNLHGMPGLLAGIVGIIVLATASEEKYGTSLYLQFPQLAPKEKSAKLQQLQRQEATLEAGLGRTPFEQAGYQAAALLSALVIALVTGTVTGYIMKMQCLEPVSTDGLFDDREYWQVPDPEDHVLPMINPREITWHPTKVGPLPVISRPASGHVSHPTTTRLTLMET